MSKTAFYQRAGIALLIAAIVLPVSALLFPVFGLPSAASSTLVALLIAGIPELLCLAAIALLGREGFSKFRKPRAPASKLRYYGGLLYCLLNGLPMILYTYAPDWMPGGTMKYTILAIADIGFVCSVLLMGGEFWEKFRRLFVWDPPTDLRLQK